MRTACKENLDHLSAESLGSVVGRMPDVAGDALHITLASHTTGGHRGSGHRIEVRVSQAVHVDVTGLPSCPPDESTRRWAQTLLRDMQDLDRW